MVIIYTAVNLQLVVVHKKFHRKQQQAFSLMLKAADSESDIIVCLHSLFCFFLLVQIKLS